MIRLATEMGKAADTTKQKQQRKPKAYKIDDDVMNDIRLRMYYYDIKQMSEATGLSTACLYCIRAGRTKWPRGNSFFSLLEYLGIEMHLYDTRTSTYL